MTLGPNRVCARLDRRTLSQQTRSQRVTGHADVEMTFHGASQRGMRRLSTRHGSGCLCARVSVSAVDIQCRACQARRIAPACPLMLRGRSHAERLRSTHALIKRAHGSCALLGVHVCQDIPAISTGRSRPQGTPASLALVRCAHSDESPASCVDGSFTPLRRLRRPHSATFVVQETWARMALVPQVWSKTSIRAPTQVCVPACATGMNRGERCKDVDARASTPVLLPFDTCSQRGEYLLSGYWAVHV